MTANTNLKYFAEHGPEVEYLRPLPPDVTFENTETQYLGFQIPGECIQAEIWLWQGKNTHPLTCTVEAAHPALATAQLYAFWLGVRWEVEGRTGWGNCQYALWHKYYKSVCPGPGDER